jgi:hypothetical protein
MIVLLPVITGAQGRCWFPQHDGDAVVDAAAIAGVVGGYATRRGLASARR